MTVYGPKPDIGPYSWPRVGRPFERALPPARTGRAQGSGFTHRAAPGQEPELVIGQWGLIPDFAREAKTRYQTNNARSEELASKPSFRRPWREGQRCIIPADSFDEPNWESGRNVWWRFQRPDGKPWNLAGLWNRWRDPHTGEQLESYTMLTINADAHPLLRRMHRPKPDRPATAQDKRAVIPIADADVETWLASSDPGQIGRLLTLPSSDAFLAGPV